MKWGDIFFVLCFFVFVSCQTALPSDIVLVKDPVEIPVVDETVVVSPLLDDDVVAEKEVLPLCYKQHDGDRDGDGLSDYDELILYRTNPESSDTDHDLLSDYDEVMAHLTSPRRGDSDHDGLRDYDEIFVYFTDPLLMDTDGDGLLDGLEVQEFLTDPSLVDTDNDGWYDGAEYVLHTYPRDPSSFGVDNDGNLLDDSWEYAHSFSQTGGYSASGDVDYDVHKGYDSPNKVMKGDGLTNFEEQNWGTHPFKGDTDKDGLLDGDEIRVYKTHPLMKDTDGDGYEDGREVKEFHTNPLDDHDFPYLPLMKNTERDQGYQAEIVSEKVVGYWRGQEPSFIDTEYKPQLFECQKRFDMHLTPKRVTF